MAHRILLVDDEDTLRSIAARALRFKQYEVVEASDGFEAWGLAEKTRFDLVITDRRMPPLSGAEVMARLRDLQPTVPILRLSDSHDAGSEESGTRTLFKPSRSTIWSRRLARCWPTKTPPFFALPRPAVAAGSKGHHVPPATLPESQA